MYTILAFNENGFLGAISKTDDLKIAEKHLEVLMRNNEDVNVAYCIGYKGQLLTYEL